MPHTSLEGLYLTGQDTFDAGVETVIGASIGITAESSLTEINIPKVIFSILICIIGLIGNTAVIFVIVVLREYRKSVTNWYVLQLAIADSLFLLTLPFKTTEDLNKGWLYPEWMCKAKETLLFLNYYASIMFLMVMSIDRYIAVCHTLSDALQKFRKPLAAASIATTVWIICLCMCTPIMLYSATVGTHPYCSCSYKFPSPEDENNITKTCIEEGFATNLDKCLEMLTPAEGGTKYCKVLPDMAIMIFDSDFGGYDFQNYFETGGDITGSLGNSSRQETSNGPTEPNISLGDVPDSTASVPIPVPVLTVEPPVYNGFDFSFPLSNGFPDLSALPGAAFPAAGSGLLTNETANEITVATVTESNAVLPTPVDESNGIPTQCTYEHTPHGWKVFMVFNFVVMYVLPVIVMVVCYGLIINRLSSSKFRSDSTTSVTQSNGKKRKTRSRSDKDRRRVTIMCAAMVSTFVLLWLPFHVNHLAKLAGINVPTEMVYICENLPVVGSLLAYLNSALNPYLYSFLGSNFKKRWNHAAESIQKSNQRRRSSSSGGILGVRYTKKGNKRGREGSTSNNTATVMTKVYRGKSEKSGSLSETKPSLDSTHALSTMSP